MGKKMAISEIGGGINLTLLPALGRSRERGERPAPTSPTQNDTLQNASLINETLRNLNFVTDQAANQLLINEIPPLLEAADIFNDLNFNQQNALSINETLQNLNFTPGETASPLLINEITPFLAASDILSDLNLTQQVAQTINETLLNINFTPDETANPLFNPGFEPTVGGIVQPLPPAAQVVPAGIEETAANLALAASLNLNSISTETEPVTATGGGVAAPILIPTLPAAPTTAETIPVTARFVPPYLFNPAMLPLTLYPDRTPYVVQIAYLLKDPSTLPGPVEPISREVQPVLSVAIAQALGQSRLRQALRRAREVGPIRENDYNADQPIRTQEQAEKSIIYTIDQVNSNMADHDLPLHFVFARRETEIALDVYDCSYKEACRLTYDIPIPLDNLTGVLGNLQQETSIIIDKTL